ncbi:hypothetical protein [Streptomyces sp. NPDC057690]|uniref:hypothetical protein n=1 Tax=Streptomyces sp. NPDC057690 TaxID=3346214 RepID=UPI0036838AF0
MQDETAEAVRPEEAARLVAVAVAADRAPGSSAGLVSMALRPYSSASSPMAVTMASSPGAHTAMASDDAAARRAGPRHRAKAC